MFKRKTNILIISLLITMGLFVYLTIHHYSLKLGLGSSSFCEINSKINCDATATSRYSELFGIPMALLGAMFHLVLLSVVVFYRMGWVENSAYLKNFIRGFLLFSVLTSIVMAAFSTFVIQVFCPFCIGTYVFSFINLWLGWRLVDADVFFFEKYFSEYKAYPILAVLVLALSWVVSGMILENYGLGELKKRIPQVISQWKASPKYDFDPLVGISYGPPKTGQIQLVEFADFKCPHCKMAATSISSFLKGKRDIHFVLKTFPLDGNCNKAIEQKGDSTRCQLAAWALCADQIAQKGWDAQHWIFKYQEEFLPKSNLSEDQKKFEKEFDLDTLAFGACVESQATYEKIEKMAEEGVKANVTGTPAIFLNGRKLNYGQFMDVLDSAVYEASR